MEQAHSEHDMAMLLVSLYKRLDECEGVLIHIHRDELLMLLRAHGATEAPEARRERLSKACGEVFGWETKADGLTRTKVAPDAAVPMFPSESVTLHVGADGKLTPPA